MTERKPISFFGHLLLLFSSLLCCCGWFSYNITLSPNTILSPNTTLSPTTPNTTLSPNTNLTTPEKGLFVTRSGSSLMLGGKVFRFSGPNIYWLGLLENTVDYPSHFEVDDAIATATEMGATVVRSTTLGASIGCGRCVEPSLGTFNQEALQHIDYAIQSAKNHNIKLIIPLVDNWHFYEGGKHTFTNWHGISDENQFYSNTQVMDDFKQYISTLLNRKNSYSGIVYKDDPTIMAWETGNELSAPVSWERTISSYIKSVDPNHLVIDGNYVESQAKNISNLVQDLNIDTLDIYTGHYYPPNNSSLNRQLSQILGAKKAYIVGEFDWNKNSGTPLDTFLSAIEQSQAAGDLYWSLLPHDDQHGFVRHKESFSLYYPGDTPAARKHVRSLSVHAYVMQGLSVPAGEKPGQPLITSIKQNAIAWRGAYGADTYTVERSTIGAQGPWNVICNKCATDNDTPWIDKSRSPGSAWYRVRGYSISGVAGAYSEVYLSAG